MIGIIDYGMGNLLSVKNAIEYLGYEAEFTTENSDFSNYEKLILPGVGAFPDCINNLNISGLSDILNLEVIQKRKPILGICLGMQVMASIGNENFRTTGLNWFDAEIDKMSVINPDLKIPHVGWADVKIKNHYIFEGLNQTNEFYFVHSYYMNCRNEKDVIATIHHEKDFTAAIAKDNIIGCQFHPEKSQESGLILLKNFIKK